MTTNELNDDSNTSRVKSRDGTTIILRFLFTLLFAVLGWLTLWVLAAVILLQFGFWAINTDKNQKLHDFAGQVTSYMKNILDYVTIQTDEKPFPFAKWPEQKSAQFDTEV